MKTSLSALLLVAGLALVAGCSTPDTRISHNQEYFNSLPADQQALIREGKVGIGFNKEMVKLSLGDPDRVRTRTDATGTSEIWAYVTYEGTDGVVLYTGYYHHYYHRYGGPFYPYYLDYPARRVHTRFRVVFRQDRVIAIEENNGG